jgi:hypothetical protein
MKLADEMLLAQMRESVLQDIPENQWNLVVDEVEKAGGVRQVQGYAKVLLHDAITKASFGGNRSDAGRYAANVRWQAQVQSGKGGDGSGRKAWKGATEERLIRLFHRRYFDADGPGSSQEEDELFQERGWLDSEGKVNPQILERGGAVGKYPIPADATFDDKEAFDRADAEESPNAMPPLYNDYGDEPVNPMPPEYNDYGDEPTDTQRAGRKLMGMAVPLDMKNPTASQANATPDSPKKRKKKNS